MATETPDKPEPAAAPTPAAPGEEWKAMNAEQFKARLEETRAAGERAALKALGVKTVDEAKAALDKLRAAEEAQKTELQKAQELAAALGPKAQLADTLTATVAEILSTREAAIPEDKKALLDLAPSKDDPAARLRWIVQAEAKGLFTAAAAAAPAKPASSRAGVTPPAAATDQGGKTVAKMTDAEFNEYRRTWAAQAAARTQ